MYKTIVVDVVSVSVFGGNFVLAKVSLGLINVHCTELRIASNLGGLKCISSQSGASDLSAVAR